MTEFDKKRDELLATFYSIGTDVVVMPKEVAEALDRLELSEAKARFALEEIAAFAGEYAAFNGAMEKAQKMAEEGLYARD